MTTDPTTFDLLGDPMLSESPSSIHTAALVDALERVRADDLARLQRMALSGMRAGIEVGDRPFAAMWQALGRCVRAERGRREQAVIVFVDDELEGPSEGCLADGWSLPSGWEVEVPTESDGGGYDDR